MSGPGPKLVNKQFNSPINLYSPQTLRETLERQTKVLANGAVGIDFNQLAKPANLQNSAVLRMLEEEEEARKRTGHPSLKRVAWPPPPESEDCSVDFVEKNPVQAKTRGEYVSYQSCGPSSGVSATTLSRVSPQLGGSSSPSSPIVCRSPSGSATGGGTLLQPSHFHQNSQPKTWSPVTSPATAASTPLPDQQRAQQPWKQNLSESIEQSTPKQKQYSTPVYNQPIYEPPPSLITLRPEPPISQIPAPVYPAQPAATLAPTNGNMRGDTKWPPESVKAQTEAENRARLELAKGPAVRPRRVRKDYSGFFAQHALNSSYPGYRAPPGTQYFTPAYQQ